jgi:hypothetical protein
MVEKFVVFSVSGGDTIIDARKLHSFKKEYDSREEALAAIQEVLNEYFPETYRFTILPIYYNKR